MGIGMGQQFEFGTSHINISDSQEYQTNELDTSIWETILSFAFIHTLKFSLKCALDWKFLNLFALWLMACVCH